MIVNHEHNFIFLKTRKTAGTSIEIALSQFCSPSDIITPISPEDEVVRQKMGGRGPQNYHLPLRQYRLSDWVYSFKGRQKLHYYNHAPSAFVRQYIGKNIWDSYYKFCFERNPFDKAISRYFWGTRKQDIAGFQYFLESAPRTLLSDWDIYTIDNRIAVDFIGHYETLEEDLATVLQQTGISKKIKLPHVKGSYRKDRRHYSKLIDIKSRRLIEAICSNEISAFSYDWVDE